MIPGGWTTKRFADIADYKAGRTPARANPLYWKDAEDGVPWVAISDMTDFGTVIETKEKITKVAFNEVFRGQAVRAGTLIMSFKLTIGRVATLGIDACQELRELFRAGSIVAEMDVGEEERAYFDRSSVGTRHGDQSLRTVCRSDDRVAKYF